jgi:DNA replication protein
MLAKDPQRKLVESLLLAGLKEGAVAVPYLLLKHYRQMKLSELEVMIIIQLIAFIDKENNDFPTLEEIQARMSATPEIVISGMQKLMKMNYLTIDERVDAVSGVQYERYNLDPLYEKLAQALMEEYAAQAAQSSAREDSPQSGKDIYSIMEKEFARPLTPMEFETISGWLDKDKFSEDLILAALKEAVFAGKVHFRYIDRILLEWSRNRVSTPVQDKEYAQRYRQSR